jgi:hypothetical protein
VGAAAYAAANDRIRKEILAYADERGPRLAALAVIVGWPDPNPESKGDPTKMRVIQKHFFLEAQRLRKELAVVDKDFSDKVAGIMNDAQGKFADEQAAGRLDIDKFRDDLNRNADAEAARQVRSTPKELDIRLAGARTTVLPATPPSVVTIPATAPFDAPPKVTFTGVGLEDQRRLVEHDLRIWLALNRFSLSKSKKGAKDKTDEFLKWRKSILQAGP